MKRIALTKTAPFVAKLVKSFGRLGGSAETLDEFRYKRVDSVVSTCAPRFANDIVSGFD